MYADLMTLVTQIGPQKLRLCFGELGYVLNTLPQI